MKPLFAYFMALAILAGSPVWADSKTICEGTKKRNTQVEGIYQGLECRQGYCAARILQDNGEEIFVASGDGETNEGKQFTGEFNVGDRVSINYEITHYWFEFLNECQQDELITNIRLIAASPAPSKTSTNSSKENIRQFQNRFGYTPGTYVTCHVNFPDHCKEESKKYKINPDGYSGTIVSFFIDSDRYKMLVGTYSQYNAIPLGWLDNPSLSNGRIEVVDRNTLIYQNLNKNLNRYENSDLLVLVQESLDLPNPILIKEISKAKEEADKNQEAVRAAQSEFDALLARSQQGDADAQYKLGTLYFGNANIVVPKDIEQALAWLLKAAEKKQVMALKTLASIYASAHSAGVSMIMGDYIQDDDGRSSSTQVGQLFFKSVDEPAELQYNAKSEIGTMIFKTKETEIKEALRKHGKADQRDSDYTITQSLFSILVLEFISDAANQNDSDANIFFKTFFNNSYRVEELLSGLPALAKLYASDKSEVNPHKAFVMALNEKCGASLGFKGQVNCLQKEFRARPLQLKSAGESAVKMRDTSVPPAASTASKAQALQKTFTNSIGMEFVLIPAGKFQFTRTVKNDFGEEVQQQSTVSIGRPFYMGKYEVTQEQWVKVMGPGSNPSRYKGRTNPVENVMWTVVQDFIQELNRKEGEPEYRLPTDAEWEHAARAGTSGLYFFGDSPADLDRYAWLKVNSQNSTHPVGQKQPNPWGLYDIYGNVAEMVWFDESDYMAESSSSSTGGVAVRGGDYYSSENKCRSASREAASEASSYDQWGFRLVFSPPDQFLAVAPTPSTSVQMSSDQIEELQRAADRGDAIAQFNLGEMYRRGEEVAQDFQKAVEWYQNAADQGYADAQNGLGSRYYHGQGVLKDYQKAVEWYQKAADQGHAMAQNNLARRYYLGEGVLQDFQKAAKWYQKAADQGYPDALLNLGRMYFEGEGVRRDQKKGCNLVRQAVERESKKAVETYNDLCTVK